jgi:predicted transport protein
MNLYKLNNTKLEEVKNIPFKLEKDIQSLVEGNIQVLFGLEFVKTEFQLNGLRIDTLGFDQQSKSFVIIEYKKNKSYSVIDQGYSYLSLLLNNKADFILEYLERTNKTLRKDDVDWSQSRVIFISPQFTTYQKQSIEFKDLPFELWEIKKYSNDTIVLNQHKSTSQESVKTINSKDDRAEQVSKEIVVYTEEDHLKKGSSEIEELAISLRDRILELDNIEIVPVKFYIGFKIQKRVITDFEVQKTKLKLRINLKKGQLDDPKKIFRDVANIGTFGVGDYEAVVTPDSDIDYLMSLIKQSYNFHNSQ